MKDYARMIIDSLLENNKDHHITSINSSHSEDGRITVFFDDDAEMDILFSVNKHSE